MITIKPVEPEQLAELSLLYEELVGVKTNLTKLERVYRSVQASGGYTILCAYLDGVLVGSLMGIVCQDFVGECRPFMVIENVIVSGRARKQGVGTRLMQEIERLARQQDCAYIIFVSGEERKEAHRLYERLGYRDEKAEGFRKHL